MIQAMAFSTALNVSTPGKPNQFTSGAVNNATFVDCAQGWYWSARWQQMEKEADEDIAAGNVRRFNDLESLFADLDSSD